MDQERLTGSRSTYISRDNGNYQTVPLSLGLHHGSFDFIFFGLYTMDDIKDNRPSIMTTRDLEKDMTARKT